MYLQGALQARFMKTYILLFSFLAMGVYTVGQSWVKKYDRIDASNCGLALVKKDGKFGFINEEGKVIVPLIYSEATAFSEDKGAVAIHDKWGFVDINGNEFVKPQYDDVYSFHEGLAVVINNDTYGFIDSTGKIAIPIHFLRAGSFSDGIAPVCNKKGLWGYIDKNGNEVIACRFNYATTFTDSTGRVVLNGIRYSIDKTGNIVKQ
jgi:hypothetical protein